MDVKDVDLLSLLPMLVRRDTTAQAMAEALRPVLRDLGAQSGNALIFTRLNELDDEIVDELAWERHVDFYDSSLPLETKRELVGKSEELHRYKGTPYAVELLAGTVFGDGEVEEWFDYGGEPHMFRVITTNPSVSDALAGEFKAAVESVKNKSSWLEEVIIAMVAPYPLFFGFMAAQADVYTVKQVM